MQMKTISKNKTTKHCRDIYIINCLCLVAEPQKTALSKSEVFKASTLFMQRHGLAVPREGNRSYETCSIRAGADLI